MDDGVGGDVAAVGAGSGRTEEQYNGFMASIDITALSLEERLRLLDELWESLAATPEAIPLTSLQREELDRRLDELEREGPVGIPWEEVLDRIRRHTL